MSHKITKTKRTRKINYGKISIIVDFNIYPAPKLCQSHPHRLKKPVHECGHSALINVNNI